MKLKDEWQAPLRGVVKVVLTRQKYFFLSVSDINCVYWIDQDMQENAGMLVIKEAQIEKLKMSKVDVFVAKMINHLREIFGGYFERIEDEKIANYVRDAMSKAKVHGFSTEKNICAYIDFLLIFGWNFDSTLEWANSILRNQKFTDQDMRIEALFAAAHCYPQDVRSGLLSSRKVSS